MGPSQSPQLSPTWEPDDRPWWWHWQWHWEPWPSWSWNDHAYHPIVVIIVTHNKPYRPPPQHSMAHRYAAGNLQTGYRKVVGDTCEGGWQPQQASQRTAAVAKHEDAAEFWIDSEHEWWNGKRLSLFRNGCNYPSCRNWVCRRMRWNVWDHFALSRLVPATLSWLVVWNIFFVFHILGIIIPID